MNVIIAGSRRLMLDAREVGTIVERSGFDVTHVTNGGAHGVDQSGEDWARRHAIPVTTVWPNWSLGKKAGPLRNKKMAEEADALILIWDGESKGAASMKREAERAGIPIFEVVREES